MSSDDSKQSRPDANFPGAPPVKEPFNKAIDLEAQIATLSPAGQKECRAIQSLSYERLETEMVNQKRSHEFRVLKTYCQLLENSIRHPAPRPPGVVADPAKDLTILRDQAEQSARDREANWLKNVQRESEANIRQVIARERKGHEAGRTGRDHDHEHGG